MYGLPADFDVKVFSGRVLEQVSFREYQVVLFFDQEISITVEGDFAYLASDGTPRPGDTGFPPSDSAIMALLGKHVSEATGSPDGTLSLVFENGEQFICYDNPHYESYHIRNKGATIIV